MVKATYESYVSDERALKKFVRQMLKNHVFIGTYMEQRYVSSLGTYKKIIKVSNEADVFIENLSVAKRRLEKFYNGSKWIGITFPDTPGAPVGFNLWTNIEEEIFGDYKFIVKDILFNDNVQLELQVVQVCESGQNESELNSMNYSEIFTWENVKNSIVFIFLLLTAIVTGGGQLLMFLMDYSLKFMKEFNNFIKVSTPMFIACLDLLSKMFGYICVLIACLFSNKKIHINPNEQRRYVPIRPYETRYKAIQYRPTNSVKITELN